MFDIDSGKLLIVAVLALIVIGPKELPRVLRQIGQSVGKLRRMAGEFQGQFMDAMKEADLADIRKDLDELNKSAALDVHFDPARDIQSEFTSAMKGSPITASADTASPAADYVLPPLPGEGAELGSVGAGIAPVADPAEIAPAEPDLAEPALAVPDLAVLDQAPTAPALPDEAGVDLKQANGAASAHAFPHAKRRVVIKRRTSRMVVMLTEAEANRTGEPFAVHRRIVRAKGGAAAEQLPTS